MTTGKPDLLGPALVGGLVGAALTLLPPFCCLNCCCCLNYILGGALAGALYARGAAKMNWLPQAGEGASVGALAGFIAGLAHGAVGALLALVWFLAGGSCLGGAAVHGPVRVDAWEWESCRLSGLSLLAMTAGHLVVHIVLGAVAGLVGGILGVLLFRRGPVAPQPGAGDSPPQSQGPTGSGAPA